MQVSHMAFETCMWPSLWHGRIKESLKQTVCKSLQSSSSFYVSFFLFCVHWSQNSVYVMYITASSFCISSSSSASDFLHISIIGLTFSVLSLTALFQQLKLLAAWRDPANHICVWACMCELKDCEHKLYLLVNEARFAKFIGKLWRLQTTEGG